MFEFPLSSLYPVFGYWDEFYASLAFPLIAINLNNKIKLDNFIIFFVLFLFIAITLFGNILYRYQTISYVLIDLFSHLKFPLSIITTIYLFNGLNFQYSLNKIKRQIFFITDVLFILLIFNYIIPIFPSIEIRFGLPSQQLFFGHPTALASISFFLLMLITLKFDGMKKDNFHIIMLLIIIASTLRVKAIISAFAYVYLYFWIIVLKRKISFRMILTIAIFAIIYGWDQISFYYLDFRSTLTARGALTYTSFQIAKDYFPLGSGFGTFGSAPSGDNYSPLYYLYGISNIWGLSRRDPVFVSDTFWPMILGQSGYLGLVLYILFLIGLFKKFSLRLRGNPGLYATTLGAFSYLLISSTSESAFVNPAAVLLGFVLGLATQLFQEENKLD